MLSIVATPIGNLGDITLRAIETLKTCDAIVCEDSRVTGRLLQHLGIPKKELISFHSHTHPQKIDAILERLAQGQHLALVSDAGTPGISDPGYALISQLVKEQEHRRDLSHPAQAQRDAASEFIAPARAGMAKGDSVNCFRMTPVPGPSAFLTALSASGLPINHFLYLGFLPLKKGRQTLLRSLASECTTCGERSRTIVFYESVHRIERTLRELAEVFQDQPQRPIVIARELTKLYEEILRTTVADLPSIAGTITKKGEFVVIIGPLPQ